MTDTPGQVIHELNAFSGLNQFEAARFGKNGRAVDHPVRLGPSHQMRPTPTQGFLGLYICRKAGFPVGSSLTPSSGNPDGFSLERCRYW